ncbi:MAG TPA: hypothetical protein VHR41_07360 [Gemmatimonadales bacterium]|nr:hypothetical protein [Gemmatimonadales bacterium]
MAAGHAGTVERAAPAVDEMTAASGGALRPEPTAVTGESDRQERKSRKRETKLRRESERPPDSFERFRILMEMVSEGRQVVALADHKARYALVVMGVLNAGIFFLMSPAHLIVSLPQSIKPWLVGSLIAYAALSCVFVLHAIDCLRPRQLHYSQLLSSATGPSARGGQGGLMYWEATAGYELEAYRHAWDTVHMDQINGEVVVIAHRLALLIRAKYAALGKLYAGLVVLVVLAGVLLAVYTVFALAA